MKKRLFSLLLALLLLTAVPLGSAAGADHPEKQQFTIQKADRLMAAAGMDAREWENRMAEQKAAGLSNPVTEENLRAANAGVKFHRQNGRIYMIEGADALGAVHGPLDACRAGTLAIRRQLAELKMPALTEALQQPPSGCLADAVEGRKSLDKARLFM